MFRQGTCGLILNTGMYLSEDDITPEIRNFCEEHSYPLFTMPVSYTHLTLPTILRV